MNRNQPVWQNVLVRSFENEFNKTKIVLPVKNNEIDFNFMETFISELENNRLEPLRNYLKSDS